MCIDVRVKDVKVAAQTSNFPEILLERNGHETGANSLRLCFRQALKKQVKWPTKPSRPPSNTTPPRTSRPIPIGMGKAATPFGHRYPDCIVGRPGAGKASSPERKS